MKINYKDFSPSDYALIISYLIESKLFPDIEGLILRSLHTEKYRRLRELWNKKVTEHEVKFGKYKTRGLPKHLMPEYTKYVRYMDALKKNLNKQVEILKQIGVIQDKPEGEHNGI
ncbi:MAG: hypothetical protein PHV10_07810 [Sulfuricurvum sp.]|nr:hypothetical protein [Sulfuricurvum sp.]